MSWRMLSCSPECAASSSPPKTWCPARDQQSPAADAGPSNGACAGTILPFEFRITASQLEFVPDRGDSLLGNDEQEGGRKILGQVSKIGDGLRVGETGPELVLDESPHMAVVVVDRQVRTTVFMSKLGLDMPGLELDFGLAQHTEGTPGRDPRTRSVCARAPASRQARPATIL